MNIPRLIFLLQLAVGSACCLPRTGAAVDFARQIQPIIESACLRCHSGDDPEGTLRFETRALALPADSDESSIVPGYPEKSSFYTTTLLPSDHEDAMPPEGPPLTKPQTALIRKWIEEGADWPADAMLQVKPRIDFKAHIQPLLEENCLTCHQATNAEGDYDLSARSTAFTGTDEMATIVPYRPEASSVYTLTVLARDDDQLMPPRDQGGPLAKELTTLLRLWIEQGAEWPDGVTLRPKEKKRRGIQSPDNLELVRRIHEVILERSATLDADAMDGYREKIPQTEVEFSMVPIPAGEFLMGSPDSEANRQEHEGPQTRVKIGPFWMGKLEVTWDEYHPFMATAVERHKNGMRKDYDPAIHTIVDAVSRPTSPYMEMSFGMGRRGYPAISMTQHAANKYCQWLSAQTGHFYRLPTEAEWEYACRAGTTSAYHFGNDAAQLGQYAWYYDNSNEKYQKVGQKKPNSWGLHDMHGNVSEWTADQFVADYFTQIEADPNNPIIAPKTLYPRTVRGGSWYDDPEQLRSAYRFGSDASWKQQDPQLPKSKWYHTDARWLGFRIVRPLRVPTVEEMNFYWNSAANKR